MVRQVDWCGPPNVQMGGTRRRTGGRTVMIAIVLEPSLMSFVKRHTPLIPKTRIRACKARLQIIGSRHYCPVCRSRVRAFQPVPAFYRDNLTKFGWPYPDDEAETCNQSGYSCPSCQAS